MYKYNKWIDKLDKFPSYFAFDAQIFNYLMKYTQIYR